jgi:hypothetical protein
MTGPFTAKAVCAPPNRWREKAAKSERNNEMRDGNRAMVTTWSAKEIRWVSKSSNS